MFSADDSRFPAPIGRNAHRVRFRSSLSGNLSGEEVRMGDKADRASGAAKEAAGRVTGDRDLAEKGRREQIMGDVKKSGKKLKDAAKKM